MKLQFNENGKACNLLAGGKTYLLQKSCLVFQMKGERNYHVFYQLFTGCSDAQKAEWRLDDPEKFNYLNQSGCVSSCTNPSCSTNPSGTTTGSDFARVCTKRGVDLFRGPAPQARKLSARA